MSNNMRVIKFETFIKDINKAIKHEGRISKASGLGIVGAIDSTHIEMIEGMHEIFSKYSTQKHLNLSLLLIYDYSQLNEYGKIIVEQSKLHLTEWQNNYSSVDDLKDDRIKINAAKELINQCRMEENRFKAYKFIFWSMMILTVDKTNQTDTLSLICDFAKMLKVSDDEMMDILHVVKYLYYPEMKEVVFKSNTIPAYFSNALNLYN